MLKPVIMIVEDASELRELIAGYLSDRGFSVIGASSAMELCDLLPTAQPRVVLLDIGLPDGDGIALARKLRIAERCALIFITANGAKEIASLDAGGDDFITKPIDLPSLHARIRSVMRRARDSVIVFEGWIIDLVRRELFRPNGQMLDLTSGEFNVLAALAARIPEPLDRDFLLDVISNRDPRNISAHTVDNLIVRLRRKMGADGSATPIVTVRGVGYALCPKS